ncbi:MAG: L-rhamnose mutarotase [Saprospiraceae bacterium]|nr:L-rhamnose mutarotase [Saprospiraceae bacterium]
MARFCYALDLKNDPDLINEYEKHHRSVWPEIVESIKDSGINEMEIYRVGNRMFMVMETDDNFDFERKKEADLNNETVQEWERLMWKYQAPLSFAKEGEKWIRMKQIFKLSHQ